jgi:hypothetical protein
MKDRVELLVSELFLPIHRGQVLSDEIAAIAPQIFEIARAKVVDHGEAGTRNLFLQGERKIRADETGPASDEKIGRRCGHEFELR